MSAPTTPAASTRKNIRRYGLAALAIAGAAVFGLTLFSVRQYQNLRRVTEDKNIALPRIEAAVQQYFLEHPERIFVTYDHVIGPKQYLKNVDPVDGVDYHEIFPLRVDWDVMAVTMSDGRKNMIVGGAIAQVLPKGEVRATPAGLELFATLVTGRKHKSGLEISTAPGGGRFETMWRDRVREGPFRAYYKNGRLWATATYVHNRPVGAHVLFDPAGNEIFRIEFPAPATPRSHL